MNIIKVGKSKEELEAEHQKMIEKTKKAFREIIKNPITCPKCGSILEASKDDIRTDRDPWEYIICPNCGKDIIVFDLLHSK